MSKNVAVFVDVANIFYAAKAAGVDIDYVTLLKATTAGRDFVRAYAYTGLDPENENQRNFHAFLARHGYKVVSKDIRKYGDGKVKANLDIELVVDMMKTARNLDIAVVVSGDGDFAPAIRAVQEMGVRVEVLSFRGNTSSDLIDVADLFTDITQVAKVEKGSSRSGRRVAGDEEDLSMTEVPEKQTEGTSRRRGRGTRGGRATEPTPVARAEASRGGRASRARPVALPGERLSRLGPAEPEAGEPVEEPEEAEALEAAVLAGGEVGHEAGVEAGSEGEEGGRRRRRRRRGGRGRGRGRGLEGAEAVEGEGSEGPEGFEEAEEAEEAEPVRVASPGPRPTPFGSVWDSQIGVPRAPLTSAGTAPPDEEEFEEPEIPEYLIAERNRARTGRGGGRGPRGGRSAYAAALDRERFGGGRSSSINRYPDVSGRGAGRPEPARRAERDRPERARPERGERPERRERSSEPWSEVPPELEELLRAQMAARPGRPAEAEAAAGSPDGSGAEAAAPVGAESPKRPGRGRGRGRGTAASEGTTGQRPEPTTARVEPATAGVEPATAGVEPAAASPSPRRRSRRTPSGPGTPSPEAAETGVGAGTPEPVAAATVSSPDAATGSPRRTTRRTPATGSEPTPGEAAAPSAEAPARTTRRRTTRTAAVAEGAGGDDAGAAAEAAVETPKRRTRRTAAGGG